MSFELIDKIDEKYPLEHFTRKSVYHYNIEPIMDKLQTKIIELKQQIFLNTSTINSLNNEIILLKNRLTLLEKKM